MDNVDRTNKGFLCLDDFVIFFPLHEAKRAFDVFESVDGKISKKNVMRGAFAPLQLD